MRLVAILLGVLAVLFLPSAEAVTKCVGADGKVAYLDGPCPAASKPAALKSGNVDDSPKSPAEELACAKHWLNDKEEFESEIGLVLKTDQIIMNGREVDMVALAKRPAHTAFDYRACGKYGYVRAKTLTEFSVNYWTAMTSACRLASRPDPRGECRAFALRYPNASVLERELRADHHPIP